jgi:hypothetical protein
MHYGFRGCGHSTRRQTRSPLTGSHRLLTWTPTNCDSRYATGVLECINMGHSLQAGMTRKRLNCDDGVVTAFPITKQYRFSDTDIYSEEFTALENATLRDGLPRRSLIRSTDYATPQTIDRLHFRSERADIMNHGISFCQLFCPPSTIWPAQRPR